MVSLKKPSLLVLGGTGFIGKNLIKRAITKKWKVYSASLSIPKKNKKIQKVKYYKVDLTKISSVKKNLNKSFNYVVNLSGYINHSNSKSNYKKIINDHFISTKNIIEVLPKENLKKFLQIGTSLEYGLAKGPQNEKNKLSPKTTYSLAKAKSTKFLQSLFKKEKYPFTIARLFLTYGPGQKKDRFIPEIINQCLKNKKFPTSSGLEIRDFCYIDDTIAALILILTSNKTNGEIFNVASGVPIKIKTVIDLINESIGLGIPEFNKRKLRQRENKTLYADIRKIKKILNWKPKTKIKIGLKKTIEYFKNKNKY